MDIMKKFVFILAVVPVIFVIVNCRDGSVPPPPSTRKFWAYNMDTKKFYQVDAAKLAENSICEVWAESGSGVTPATANSVANAYYSAIYPKMMNTFGYTVNDKDLGKVNIMEIAHWLPTGKTSGAKLTILLLDIKDGYSSGGDAYVGGYFHSVNLYKKDPADNRKYSNELDMIYVDTYPSVPGSDSSNETIAHEMQHLMNFVSTFLFRNDPMDTWIDEGLSTAAEWVYTGKHPEVRWKYYIEDRSNLIKKGNNFYIWDNHGSESPLANLDDYATAYLFFQYLRLQSVEPKDIYYDILTSKFSNYQAVTTATNINNTHKNNWQLLLRDWHAANYTNAASGPYGYKDDATLKQVKAPMVPAGTTSVNLYPGEGVYSKTTTAESVPSGSGNIRYAGLSSSGATPNDSTGFANGARLTYNVDTNKEGSFATGNTTGIAPSMGISITDISGSVQIDPYKFTGPFKVDAGYFLRRNGDSGMPDNEIMRNVSGTNNGRTIDETNITLKVDRSTIERVFIYE